MKPPPEADLLSITLFTDLVTSFSVDKRNFEMKLSSDGNLIFYEKKSSNPSFQVFVLHQKKVQEKYAEKNELYDRYTATKTCYLQRGNEMFLIDSEKDLYQYFPEQHQRIDGILKPYSRKQRKKPEILLLLLNELHLASLKPKIAVE